MESRKQKCWAGMRPGLRRRKTFQASWSSARPRQESARKTHKETDQRVAAAARTAGFLLWSVDPITRPLCEGLVVDVHERNGAESLSQRYHFCSTLLHRMPQTLTIVHDDA